MTTRGEMLRAARGRLRAAGVSEPEADARLLAMAALGLDHTQLVLEAGVKAAPEAAAILDAMLARRIAGEPVGRILGWAEFWGLRFTLSDGTLEPRADSEAVIEAALDWLGDRRGAPLALADLGTGSGCLLAALLSECPQAHGTGVDLSADAVATARANLAALGFGRRAAVIHGSWTAAGGPFDLLVSNPPYIRSGEIGGLAREVRDGGAVLEIGFDQADDVTRIAAAAGLRRHALRRDLQGHDRALVFTLG